MSNPSEIKFNNENVHDSVIINQVKQILPKSYEYNDLLDRLNTQEQLFALLPEGETEKRLKTSGRINDLKDFIERFKSDVLQLAEQFNRIEINTDRLQRAKAFFDKGEFGEARAVLETELEQMRDEQAHLLREKEHFETEVLPKLINNSEEFFILALTTQANYSNPNRYQETRDYFERSIESRANESNVFQYAAFLQEHNQFTEAEKYYSLYLKDFAHRLSQNERAVALNSLAILYLEQNKYDEALKEYEEALRINRALAEANPNRYLSELATNLNNLAILHRRQNKYDEALKEYEDALQIYRALAETNPTVYLSHMASLLNNLALLHHKLDRYEEALKEYEEALRIKRALAEAEPNVHLSLVAGILHNTAILHQDRNEYEEALKKFDESLRIYRELAETNPNAYLPLAAMTSNNLANLHSEQNKYEEALKEYEESLQIKRILAETYPHAYLPDVATTLNNLGLLHGNRAEYEEASKEFEEALRIRRALAEANPNIYLPFLAITLNDFATLQFKREVFEDALQKFEESTRIFRELTAASVETYFPQLAIGLVNLALFYQKILQQREKSIACAMELMMILLPNIQKISFAQEYFVETLSILGHWGLSDEEIQQLIDEKMKETEENQP